MSAVEDVAARIQRLQETLALKRAQLQRLHLQNRYNASLGVDEDIESGASVAVLEVRVVGARGVAFSSGFLSGESTCAELLGRSVTGVYIKQAGGVFITEGR